MDSLTLGAFYVVGYVVYSIFIKPLGRGVILGITIRKKLKTVDKINL